MHKSSLKSKYEIPLTVVVFLLILYWFFRLDVLIVVALVVGLCSLLSDRFVDGLSYCWTNLLKVVGFVNAHVLLSVVFFLMLTPIALLYRFFNRDSLDLKPGKRTYFKERNHRYRSTDLEHPW